MLKKIWNGMLSVLPGSKLGKVIFYAFFVIFAGVVAYCWVSHFLSAV